MNENVIQTLNKENEILNSNNKSTNKEIVEISVEDIIPNRFQPRLTFDEEALKELADSIREHGIIQPLVVRKLQDKYEIIAGERRYKAATLIGMQKVPCIVMNLNDNESAEVAVIENIQRKEMTPLEEAKSFKKILDKGYLTQEELAKKMGKSQSNIANKLRLLNLDDVVQDAILNGKISERHARSLLKLESKQDQRNVLTEILEKRLTVRQTDDFIKEKFGIGVEKENMDNNINENNIFKVPSEPQIISSVQEQNSYSSSPQINIPNQEYNQNPQANILNNVGMPNINSVPTNDIFKFNSQPQTQMSSEINKEEINNIINPSVLSAPTPQPEPSQQITSNPIFNNGMNVDINQVKNMAQDIIQREEKPMNAPNLMSSDSSRPENKFFVDLNMAEESIRKEPLPFKVQSAVDAINRRIEEIKLQGTFVRKEEKDLGNTYEIVIRIDK